MSSFRHLFSPSLTNREYATGMWSSSSISAPIAARQLSQPLIFPDFKGFDRRVHPRVHYVTMTEYDETYGVPFAVPGESFAHILGEVASTAGKETASNRRNREVSARHLFL